MVFRASPEKLAIIKNVNRIIILFIVSLSSLLIVNLFLKVIDLLKSSVPGIFAPYEQK